MSEKIRIESNEDLIKFIQRDDITLEAAMRISEKYLNAYGFAETKEQHIKDVKEYIKRFGNAPCKPIFMPNYLD